MTTLPVGWTGLSMVSGWPLLLIFVGAVLLLLILIIKVKLNPFLAMMVTSLAIGFAANMPLVSTTYLVDGVTTTMSGMVSVLTSGFGSTMTSVGIVIAEGIIFGSILSEARATEAIAKGLLRITGTRRATLAVALAGFLISIPVYMDAAFIIMIPIVIFVAKETKTSIMPFVCALGAGTIVGHALVIPPPGPMAVAEAMGANVGGFLLYALIAGFVAVVCGGWLYGKVFRKDTKYLVADDKRGDNVSLNTGSDVPGFGLSMCALLLPIVIILVSNIITNVVGSGNAVYNAFSFIGDKNVALLIGVFGAVVMLRKYIVHKPFGTIVSEAADSAGMILLVTGAGGAFGNMINTCGIGDVLVNLMGDMGISLVILGFVLSAVLRLAQGSTTVALVTTSNILGPALATMIAAGNAGFGGSAVLVGLAICAGGIGFSMPNDSGFWVLSRFSGLSVSDTLRTWTAGGTIASISAFIVILIIAAINTIIPLPLL